MEADLCITTALNIQVESMFSKSPIIPTALIIDIGQHTMFIYRLTIGIDFNTIDAILYQISTRML